MRSLRVSDKTALACDLSAWAGATDGCRWCNEPLPLPHLGQTWCEHGQCEAAWRREHTFAVARQYAIRRDGQRCVRCGLSDAEAKLEVHHRTPVDDYSRMGCAHHVAGLVTLCASCHRLEHNL